MNISGNALFPPHVVSGHGLYYSKRNITKAEALLSFFVPERGKSGIERTLHGIAKPSKTVLYHTSVHPHSMVETLEVLSLKCHGPGSHTQGLQLPYSEQVWERL